MSLKEEIESASQKIFQKNWVDVVDGKVIPNENSKLTMGNDGIRIDGTVLYADLAKSTELVKNTLDLTAAEIYKAFLMSTCKVIKANGGEITAFDGDRVMAVFMGNSKNTTAVKTALHINYAVTKLVQPAYNAVYKDSTYNFEFGIGVDFSSILVAKTGIRNANDLVWVGNAANIAAKLSSIRKSNKCIWISENVYHGMHESSKLSNPSKINMWEVEYNPDLKMNIFGSNWYRPI